jgi:transposase
MTCLSAIKIKEFLIFVEAVADRYNGERVSMFLDNLRLHHSRLVATRCEELNIKLVFNAAYASENNPVENLWQLAKRIFRKELISVTNFKDSALI